MFTADEYDLPCAIAKACFLCCFDLFLPAADSFCDPVVFGILELFKGYINAKALIGGL